MKDTESLYISRQDVATNSIYGEENEIEPNEAVHITSNVLGELSIIRKKTPYVDNVSDLMILPIKKDYSQITEMNAIEGGELLAICSDILDLSATEINGRKFISINQQIECSKIPNKFGEDGTELKVQTINKLHPHVFVLPNNLKRTWHINELKDEDYHDFYDEFSLSVSEYIYQNSQEGFFNTGAEDIKLSFQSEDYPLGIIINIPKPKETVDWGNIFQIMSTFQSKFIKKYYEFYEILFNNKGELRSQQERYKLISPSLESSNLSEQSKRSMLKMLVVSRESSLEERKYLRFVQGPALTWLIELKEDATIINPAFRFVSRGNAMESLGIWVDQDYGRQDTHQTKQLMFYNQLINNLSKYHARKGTIYKFIQNPSE